MKLLLTLLTSIFFLACSSDKEQLQVETNLTAYSNDIVKLKASGAKAYSWRQLSGTDVILVDAHSVTASFIAPSVTKEESLVFELEALIAKVVNDDITLKKQVQVTVHPKATKDMDSTSPEVEPEQQTNETNTTTETNTTQATVSLTSLKLTIEKTSLNIETNTTLKVLATYSDNIIKDITNEVEWIYEDKLALDIKNNILKTNHKDTNIFIQAKYNNKLSNQVALEIYKEISGHRLPPEPNPTINNSTLLGIDSNNNGVRDDVERKIYETYDKKVNQKLMMQSAKTHQAMLADPDLIQNAYDWQEPENKDFGCRSYLFRKYKIPLDPNYTEFLNDNTYNTEERVRKYMKYNQALSGGVFGVPESARVEESCDFNVTEALGL
jgi:hypothetical protein